MASSRDSNIFLAKVAEQAEAYPEMVDLMRKVIDEDPKLNVDERNLLSVAYKVSFFFLVMNFFENFFFCMFMFRMSLGIRELLGELFLLLNLRSKKENLLLSGS